MSDTYSALKKHYEEICDRCQAYEAELADYAQTVTKLRQELADIKKSYTVDSCRLNDEIVNLRNRLAECRNYSKRTDMKTEDRYEADKMGHGYPDK